MKNIVRISLFVVSLLSFAQCNSPKTAEEKTATEATQEVSIKEQVAKGAFLVDVRTPEEFAMGSVKGAVNIPVDEVESRVNEFKGKPYVILFCRSGHRAGIAKTTLENAGIKNVTNGINTETVNAELAK